ncbi:Detected protein of unknown function [Hibiscus syriacus]|uniref:Uncharacterized protein n=1 Tax=Hibiscus syriacus TaxID=106335 RepID=A0A6A3AA57_HIBSY|nr:Detected protein of unknown function [Hibiscus syriacus]
MILLLLGLIGRLATFLERLQRLVPKDKNDILSFSWMKLAMESLSEIHCDINGTHLSISHPNQSQEVQVQLSGSLCHSESQKATPVVETCPILDKLVESLNLPKVKNSAKGKVLMNAMYGAKVATTYICSVFAAAFSGSTKNLLDLPVPATLPWAQVFSDVQATVNTKIRNIFSCGEFTALRELHAVDGCSKKLYPFLQDGFGPAEAEPFITSVSDLRNMAETLSQGLDNLSKVVLSQNQSQEEISTSQLQACFSDDSQKRVSSRGCVFGYFGFTVIAGVAGNSDGGETVISRTKSQSRTVF